MKRSRGLKIALLATTALVGGLLAGGAQAQTWTGATSTNWATAGNWSGGVPTTGTVVITTQSPNATVLGVSSAATATSGALFIGNTSGTSGGLTIQNGSTLTNANSVAIGNATGSTGSVTVTGSGSKLTNSAGYMFIGNAGTGTLTISSSGAASTASNLYVGNTITGVGTVSLSSGGTLTVGNALVLANASGSKGTVTVDGSSSKLTIAQVLYVGTGGTGTLTLTSGATATVASTMTLGVSSRSTGTVTIDASTLTSAQLVVGNSGTGTLTIKDGGTLTNTNSVTIANASGSTGTVTVTGSGSKLTNSAGYMYVGNGGTGALTISSSGAVTTANNLYVGNASTSVGMVSLTSGGTLSVSNALVLGNSSGSKGTVTVDGSGSTLTNSSSLYVGNSGAGVLTISDAGAVTSGWSTILGNNSGSTGTLTVTGSGSSLTSSGWIEVGLAGTGALSITNGAKVSDTYASGQIYIAGSSTSVGTVTVDGSGSSLTNNSWIQVGAAGTGTLSITNGATVTSGGGLLGNASTATGTVTIDGSGSSWTVVNTPLYTTGLLVGRDGVGTLTVQNKGTLTSSPNTYIGDNSDGTGTVKVTGSGSTWTNSGTIYVGNAGKGTLTVKNAGAVTSGAVIIGNASTGTGTVTVDGSGSTLTSSGSITVGSSGTGTVTVSNGGAVIAAGASYIGGWTSTASGAVSVDGAGSSWTNTGEFLVGYVGTGSLSITNGGTVVVTGGLHAGDYPTGVGTVVVNGSSSSLTVSGQLGLGEAGTATMTVSGGASVKTGEAWIGNGHQATAIVSNATWTNTNDLVVGITTWDDRANGTLTIENGGQVTSGSVTLGVVTSSPARTTASTTSATGTILVTGSGSSLTASGALVVGETGTGSLSILSGGYVTSGSGTVGDAASGVGTVLIDGTGSTWDDTGDPIVGNAGTGTLTVQNGGTLISTVSVIGNQATGVGTVTVTGAGSTWTDNSTITVGNAGTGTLNVTNSGLVIAKGGVVVAAQSGSTGTLNLTSLGELQTLALTGGAGSAQVNFNNGELTALASNSAFVAGFSGTELNIQSGGLTIDNAGYTVTATSPFSGVGALTSEGTGTLITTAANTYSGGTIIEAGTLQLGNGGTTGSILGNVTDNGTLAFDRSNLYTFTGVISGTGKLTQIGSGTTVLTAVSTYTGTTTVAAGTLALSATGALTGGGATSVAAGATLGGYGSVAGTVTNDGTIAVADAVGAFSGGAKGTFTINGTLINDGLAQVGGSGIGNSLNVGSYVGGSGSVVALNTYLGTDGSPSDLLVINGGTATGTSGLLITNVGGAGALTYGNGILVVDAINGATTAASAFTLKSRVIAGPYEYTLYRGSTDGSSSDDWYLRSTLPVSDPNSSTPNYRQEVSLYTALPSMAQLYGRTLLDTLHERVGEEEQLRGNPGLNPNNPVLNGAWGRVIGQHGDVGGTTIYSNGPKLNYGLSAAQAGLDLYRQSHDDGARDHAGVYGAIGHLSGNVTHAGGTLAGTTSFDAYSFGAYGTHFGRSGWYADAVAQATWYDSVTARSSRSAGLANAIGLSTQGLGLAASLEGGYPVQLGNGWIAEPQAQLEYQHINLDQAADVAATVRFKAAQSLAGRLGLRVARTFALEEGAQPRVMTTWLRANLWHEFLGDNKTEFSSATGFLPFQSNLGGSWGELNAGVSGQITHNAVLNASLGYQLGLDGRRHGYDGKIGLRFNW
ncbi:autotransporter outer membrane beta-barrel domain-containing protein [Methylovirgula sp. 4M-Z18]|uniref:autotransporter outer membrane beta-barrel domain-containing protein n=1 Tax=Methylovirgula sp. 4M-Z18 TaxID=2293567 RepID=UPI0011C061A7|nr:autotransporter outer membrane beta-barrel domain-containing protein [Methylovirgula sp. 4M-Z18]